MNKKIVILAGKGDTTLFMYNGLKDEFQIDKVIVEQPINRMTFIRRRIKKLGIITVFGQIIFQLFYVKLLQLMSKKRILEIIKENDLSDSPIPNNVLIEVPSVNSEECRVSLQKLNPDIIIVNGTRIIGKKTLNCINATFVNTHVGITPKYRGVHGGYWALVNNDVDNCGVTVHLIDTGIDTGGILYQDKIEITKKDNFTTYTYIQIAKGIQLMKKALNDLINDNISIINKKSDSKLWTHPTIWGYLYTRIKKGVK